ncbi:histone acetylation protein-domain-containing protein [Crassisporium funariophilum]|nr:histone acetylation protein-domain-containing protein [Crassisporium funariophilum]
MSITLRDHLLASLSLLPGTRHFHLHVLLSSPRKSTSLFPFAKPKPPRAYLQDILLLLSSQPHPSAPRVLVSAIEACVYNLPSTATAVLYVGKVDSTGRGGEGAPSPTGCLVRGLLGYYVDPRTRPVVGARWLWVQLFARAQGQYLFAGSAEWEGKRWLGDVKLCAWWKRALTRVAADLEEAAAKEEDGPLKETKMKMYYVLPGYSDYEAEHALRIASSSTTPLPESSTLRWIYGHPYSQTDIPLPCPPDTQEETVKNLGHYIPYFDDDPKSRFMDEIAYTTDGDGVKSPQRKRTRTINSQDSQAPKPNKKDSTDEQGATDGKDKDKDKEDHRPQGEMGKVTPDEFWERMSFRQECVAGAITGFFTLIVACPPPAPSFSTLPMYSAISPLAPHAGQVSSQVNKRIMTSLLTGVEFSTLERSVKATETLEGAIKGLCEGISVIPTSSASEPQKRLVERGRPRTPEPGESSSSSYLLVPPRTPPPRTRAVGSGNRRAVMPEVSPNPFPEPVASLETYHSYVYGSVATSNPIAVNSCAAGEAGVALGGGGGDDKNSAAHEGTAHVTVLTVRKKKKRTE